MCSLCSWPRTYAQLAVWPLSRPIPQETNRALKGGRKRVGIAARLVRISKRTSIIGIGPTGGGCQPCIVEVHARSIGPRASSCVDKAPLDSAPFGRFDGRSARACAAIVSCAACRAIAGSKAGAVIASNDVTASGSTHGGSVVPELEAAGRPRIDAGALGVSTCRSMGCGEHEEEEEERVARHRLLLHEGQRSSSWIWLSSNPLGLGLPLQIRNHHPPDFDRTCALVVTHVHRSPPIIDLQRAAVGS